MGLATAGLVLGYVALVLNLMLIPAILIPAIVKARHEVREHRHRSSIDTKEVASAYGKARLTVPSDWNELRDLNDAAELQTGNKASEQYVIVLSENKSDLSNLTLQKHHQLTRDAMLEKMGNSSASKTVDLIIGGRPALQDEISGTQEGTNIVFLHTTIESDDGYHQVLAWTTKSRWEQYKDRLEEVTRSFRSEK